jgi:hypothetical protein
MYKATRQIFQLILLTSVLYSCASAEDPKAVADKYWQYLRNGNSVEAERLVSADSHDTFSSTHELPSSIEQLNTSDTIAIVKSKVTTVDPDSKESVTQYFDTVLVLEEGHWKIDTNRTHLPLTPAEKEAKLKKLSEDLSDSMQKNIESLDEAVTEGMQMLNEALRDSSQEMGDSLLQFMNDLNSTMRDSIDKMKERRQQELEEQQNQDTDTGEGMI